MTLSTSYVSFLALVSFGMSIISGCAVQPTVTNQYQLTNYSDKQLSQHPHNLSLFINVPEATSAYQAEQLRYVDKPYQLSSFVHNAWTNPPANQLSPLLMNSIKNSGYFSTLTTATNTEETDYRLDTELQALEQVFLVKPSYVIFTANLVLTHVPDKRIVGSKLVTKKVICQADTPYAGVIAANEAVKQFTADATNFIVNQVKHDSQLKKINVQ